MPKLWPLRDQLRRDDGPLDTPDTIGEGITASPGNVWAWVVLPTRSTDELNSEVIHRLTEDGASALRRLIPKGSPFHIKIQWGTWSAADYVEAEAARLPHPTEGQRRYLELGAARLAACAYPQRQVLLGIPLTVPRAPTLRRTDTAAGGEAEQTEQAETDLRACAQQAWAWHDRMAASTFAARPATVAELSWALCRDIKRTVAWLPADTELATGAHVYRLVNGGYAVPRGDHLQLATDDGTRYLRLLQPARNGFPASDMELPGDEWLKELTITEGLEEVAGPPVEVSIRGRNLSTPDALKLLRDALNLTKEQGREAAQGVAEEPPEDLLDARAVLTQRIKEVRQGSVGMVVDNVTWIVEADGLPALQRRTTALVDQYGAKGVSLWVPEHVQDVLYKETVLGDRQRFTDCEQLRPWTTLVGAWFHGGSQLGRGEGPYLAGVIGSTPGPYRDRLTDAQLADQPVTSAFLGRTRAGKSTAVMLAMLAEARLGAWGFLTDFKGDLAGVVPAAQWLGIPVTALDTSRQASGSMDFFRYVTDPAQAASMAADYLSGLLHPAEAGAAEPLIRAACNVVAAVEDPARRCTAEAVRLLAASEDAHSAAVGADLAELAKDPLVAPVAGPWDPAHTTALPTGPGLVYLRISGYRLPGRGTPPANWRPGHRKSVGLVQAALAYATYSATAVHGIPKVVGLTELHLLTGYDFGRDFIGGLARMGAALDTNLLLDTQACAELASIEGLADQLGAVYAFAVRSDAEADAQAGLLGLAPEPAVRARQQAWAPGQCEARDRWGNLAPLQWDRLCTELAELLSTTPDRRRTDDDADEAAGGPEAADGDGVLEEVAA